MDPGSSQSRREEGKVGEEELFLDIFPPFHNVLSEICRWIPTHFLLLRCGPGIRSDAIREHQYLKLIGEILEGTPHPSVDFRGLSSPTFSDQIHALATDRNSFHLLSPLHVIRQGSLQIFGAGEAPFIRPQVRHVQSFFLATLCMIEQFSFSCEVSSARMFKSTLWIRQKRCWMSLAS